MQQQQQSTAAASALQLSALPRELVVQIMEWLAPVEVQGLVFSCKYMFDTFLRYYNFALHDAKHCVLFGVCGAGGVHSLCTLLQNPFVDVSA